MSKKIDFERFLRQAAENSSDVVLSDNTRWVEQLQARLARNLPRTYRDMLTRFSFSDFETDEIWFFGNRDDNLEKAIFRDPELHPTLLANGLVQIGCPYEGNYDPICFDLRDAVRGREPPLVQFYHESILCYR